MLKPVNSYLIFFQKNNPHNCNVDGITYAGIPKQPSYLEEIDKIKQTLNIWMNDRLQKIFTDSIQW